jgi:hypothetical protein
MLSNMQARPYCSWQGLPEPRATAAVKSHMTSVSSPLFSRWFGEFFFSILQFPSSSLRSTLAWFSCVFHFGCTIASEYRRHDAGRRQQRPCAAAVSSCVSQLQVGGLTAMAPLTSTHAGISSRRDPGSLTCPARRKKTRCPGEKPACSSCARLKQVCAYPAAVKPAQNDRSVRRLMTDKVTFKAAR